MNKYKYHLRLIFMAVIVFAMQACYEDKGNYDYREINELTVGNLQDSYNLTIGGEGLKIHPDIEGTLDGGSGEYAYEWLRLGGVNAKGSAVNSLVVATTRDLDGFFPNLPAGTYTFYYRVTDKATGVKWCSQYFNVVISNTIGLGLFMMYDSNAETMVGFLNYSNSTKKFDMRNVGTSEMPVLGRPIGVYTMADVNSPVLGAAVNASNPQYAILFHTETGLYKLNPLDFTYLDAYNVKYMIVGTEPAGFKIDKLYIGEDKGGGKWVIRTNTGDILMYQKDSASDMLMAYDAPINVQEKIIDDVLHRDRVTVSDKVSSGGLGRVFFNTVTKSFLFQNCASVTTSLSTFVDTPADEFPLNNTESELLHITSRYNNGGGVYDRHYALMQEINSDKINLISFKTYNGVIKYFKQQVYPPHGAVELPHIKDAVQVAVSLLNTTDLLPFFYYRTDKEIYCYHVNDYSTRKVFTAEGNEKISLMKVLYPGAATVDFANTMAVFTYDDTKPEDTCGSLKVFSLTAPYGDLVLAESGLAGAKVKMEWSGQFGKIISADWKLK